MNKLIILFSLFLTFSFASAQEIIENPEKPLNKKAGRILKLKEEIKISDENGDFFFRYPTNVIVNSEGYIFISDYMGSNFLKFSPDGEFLKNMYRKGEGPGEIQASFGFAISQDKIFIYDFTKRKLMVTNQEGNLVSERKYEEEFFTELFGIFNEGLVFGKQIYPQRLERKSSQMYQIDHKVVLLTKDGTIRKEGYSFPNEIFLIASSLGGGMSVWDPFDAILDENSGYLYVSSSREYLIHVLDLNKGIVIRSFRRKYKRVKYEMNLREVEFMKKYNNPKKKYKEDIKNLYLNQNSLWVETSTKDDDKGIMIDVFNPEGKFTDNFFLNLDGDLISVHNNYIFVRETDEDENWVVKEYKIVE